MKMKFAAAMLCASVGLSGCATVLNGTNQPVEFQSDPAGATIELIDGRSCTTPCTFEMRRGDDTMVTFSLPEYESSTMYIRSRTSGGMAGNLLAGGIIGGAVDASNGAGNRLHPDPAHIRLARAGSGEAAVLLDKDGEVISTVAEYNAEVAEDVREGLVERGLYSSVDEVPAAD